MYELPDNLRFFLDSPISNVLVIRECYERIISILTNSASKGVIFTGVQGNSKVTYYCICLVKGLLVNLNFLFLLLYYGRLGVTYIYRLVLAISENDSCLRSK